MGAGRGGGPRCVGLLVAEAGRHRPGGGLRCPTGAHSPRLPPSPEAAARPGRDGVGVHGHQRCRLGAGRGAGRVPGTARVRVRRGPGRCVARPIFRSGVMRK